MNKEDNMTCPKEHNTLILDCEDDDIEEMPEMEFKKIDHKIT